MIRSLLGRLTLLTAAGTSLAALSVAAQALLSGGEPAWWVIARVSVAALAIVAGTVTLHRRPALAGGPGIDYLLLFTGGGLLMVGLGGLAWTIQVTAITGDPEYWVVLIELAITLQGLLTLWLARPDGVQTLLTR